MDRSTPLPDAAGRDAAGPDDLPAATEVDATEVDVVVVGFGIAGACAAVEAAAAGASVLVLERAAVAGGTSALAGGHFYLGGGTGGQRAPGHPHSAEPEDAYLMAGTPQPGGGKIRPASESSNSSRCANASATHLRASAWFPSRCQ